MAKPAFSDDLGNEMSNTKNNPRWGVTWREDVGVTWFRRQPGLLLGLCAAIALSGAAFATPDPGPSPTDVGVLGTSMVEMLDSAGQGRAVSLEDVRQFVEAALDENDDDNDSNVDGTGIDVALIDTGVTPVDGLAEYGKVMHGPDLSMEGATAEVAHLDTYGHGTHMAGIIAGEREGQEGIAPGARIVSVKVAGHDGLTTVPQVVAAIDWVIEHRQADGLNIRVLNLSLGQSGISDHIGDQLSAAVERAWNAGIFVVVAAGNNGQTQSHLDSPAIDPYVFAVGAEDTRRGEPADWTARGDGDRNPDATAPGSSIASYRVPGSTVDLEAPSARRGQGLFLGTGTSQSAAVTSGLAALILQARPELSPDELKATIVRNAVDTDEEYVLQSGAGAVNANKAEKEINTDQSTQSHPPAAGTNSDIVTPSGATWSGGTWSGATWSGATWSGATWSGGTWSGATWSGATWSGATWSGGTWSGATWSGATWSGATWSGATWSGATWSGATWSGATWPGAPWPDTAKTNRSRADDDD